VRDELLRLDTVLDRLDDTVDDGLVVALELVVAEPEELPRLARLVPHDLDDAVVELLARSLPSVLGQSQQSSSSREKSSENALFPRRIVDLHRVEKVIPFVPMIHQQHEDGLRAKVGLGGRLGQGGKLELQDEVDRVLRRRLPLEAARGGMRSVTSSEVNSSARTS
jgi:hypothetical protein